MCRFKRERIAAKGVGRFANHKFSVIDTPGINSLVVQSEDEKVTKDLQTGGVIGHKINLLKKRSYTAKSKLREKGIFSVLCSYIFIL